MTEIIPPPRSKDTSPLNAHRRTSGDDISQFRHRPSANRWSSNFDSPSPPVHRRSSNLTDFSIDDARKSIRDSTDDILRPKPHFEGDRDNVGSHWDSAPLAFALLPALGGMFFTNGSSIITDIMLLGLAAVFLNWSVRLPWDWYHSAQTIRKNEEYNGSTVIDEESEDGNLEASRASLDDIPENAGPTPAQSSKKTRRLPAQEAASNELYTHETLALLSCFLFPVLGAYLLHTIRSQLTRPSEGLVSNYNLTIFLLASELRPMAHLVKLIQARTLHLQRIVNGNPYGQSAPPGTINVNSLEIAALVGRVEELEAKSSNTPPPSATEGDFGGKAAKQISTDVRRTLQPDLDALNRAVRRYEKRATLQTMQTESRLFDIEARLGDAVALAASAAKHHTAGGVGGFLVEGAAKILVLPLQLAGAVIRAPFRAISAVIGSGRSLLGGNEEKTRKTRRDRVPSKNTKRAL